MSNQQIVLLMVFALFTVVMFGFWRKSILAGVWLAFTMFWLLLLANETVNCFALMR
jgi:hypothetical protein